MKTYIKPEVECIFFDITTPTNARTLEDWIALDEAAQEGYLTGLSVAAPESAANWADQEWTLTD